MILVDTSLWSLALRRFRKDLNPQERRLTYILRERIVAADAALIGPVRQEVLSGIQVRREYEVLREHLATQLELPLSGEVWELAAEFFNTCRSGGVSPDAIDMTISAAAYVHGAEIFTTDPDFTYYARSLPIRLYKP